MTPESLIVTIITTLLSYGEAPEPTRIPTAKPQKTAPARKRAPRKRYKIDRPPIKHEAPAITAEELLASARDGIQGEKVDTSDLDMLLDSLKSQTPKVNTYNKDDDAEASNTWLRTQ